MTTQSSQKILWTMVGVAALWSCGTFAAIHKSKKIPIQYFTDTQRKVSLNIRNLNWVFFTKDDYITKDSIFVAQPKNAVAGKSSLTFRADETDIPTAKKYADKWLRDYPKFGFELESAEKATFGNLEGFLVELKNLTSKKKIKQFITKVDKEAWVFTCTASLENFKKVWEDCEKILATSHFSGGLTK